MLRFIYFIVAIFLTTSDLFCQDNNNVLRFIYIYRGFHPEIEALKKIVQENEDDANNPTYMFPTILYYSMSPSPIVEKFNLNKLSEEESSLDIVPQLYKDWAPSESSFDLDSILNLFAEVDGLENFKSVDFSFYTDSTFWNNDYKKSIISKLYWAFDVANNSKFKFYVYYPSDKQKNPTLVNFGGYNFDNINERIASIISY